MLLMTAICHVFGTLSRFFYFVTVQPSAGSSTAYRMLRILVSDQRLHISHGKRIWYGLKEPKKWKKVFSCKSTDDYSASSGWLTLPCLPTALHWNRSETHRLTMPLPKLCGKVNLVITSQTSIDNSRLFSHHSYPLSGPSDIPTMPTCFRCLPLACFFNSEPFLHSKETWCPLLWAWLLEGRL